MTTEDIYKELSNVNHLREKRLYYANLFISHPDLVSKLLDIIFCVDDKTSVRAAWVFEFMCSKNIESIIPYLDDFTKNINRVHIDSAVRPIAKICELLAKAYYTKTENKIKKVLTNEHKQQIIEVCFDYMISDKKTAPKAYSMNTLFLFGKDFDWIHPELAIILERDFQIQSSGFKARAKHILKKIKKY